MYVVTPVLMSFLCNLVVGIRVDTHLANKGGYYDPVELLATLLNSNETAARQVGYGLVAFDGPLASSADKLPGHVTFQSETQQSVEQNPPFKFQDQANRPLKFEDDDQSPRPGPEDLGVRPGTEEFQNNVLGSGLDPNAQIAHNGEVQSLYQNGSTAGQKGQKKRRRRRRRRKPRQHQQGLPYLGQVNGNQPFPGQMPGYPPLKGNPSHGPSNYPSGQFYRPGHRPKPSIASEALSAVTGALTSVALYDDYQCVPRLLCEAAEGGTLGSAGASSGILKSIAGLQPLLTLLSAYNGVSSSPLFVFGRAVFLGVASRGAPGSCRYAYPQCPTDPEQLVHYLNNHNGGFFRFFNAPHMALLGPQNLEQFYNQLAANGPLQQAPQYGLYQPGPHQPVPLPLDQSPGDNYGFYNPSQQQNYGLYKPSLYAGAQQHYGTNYPYINSGYSRNQINLKNNKDIIGNVDNNRIEKRIQNVRATTLLDNDLVKAPHKFKWPLSQDGDSFANLGYPQDDGRDFMFPERIVYNQVPAGTDSNRNGKGFNFPGATSDRVYNVENYDYPTSLMNTNDYVYNSKVLYNTNVDKSEPNQGVEVVYVVRGNGDPNKPEIIRLRPGETVH